jgi:hypothetical protein
MKCRQFRPVLRVVAGHRAVGKRCRHFFNVGIWWWDVLVGGGDPLYRELEAI